MASSFKATLFRRNPSHIWLTASTKPTHTIQASISLRDAQFWSTAVPPQKNSPYLPRSNPRGQTLALYAANPFFSSTLPTSRELESPDVVLQSAEGVPVFLFGVQHLEAQPYIGEFILESRPRSVVVETAVTPAHGSAVGNVVDDKSWEQVSQNFLLRLCSQAAYSINKLDGDHRRLMWENLTENFPGEQLAYIAALAVGARLVYGDRPKSCTYSRLLTLPSTQDLDQAYGLSAWYNYSEVLTGLMPDRSMFSGNVFERVMIEERDEVMCSVLRQAAKECMGSCVVGVIGEAHIAGIERLWAAPRPLDSSLLDTWTPVDQSDPEAAGVRRALMESVLRLQCSEEVWQDVEEALGPVPDDQYDYHGCTYELYGTTRMLLASLTRPQLQKVCNGWRVDLWDALEPLRAVRPINGGRGYDEDLVYALRALNMQAGDLFA